MVLENKNQLGGSRCPIVYSVSIVSHFTVLYLANG